MRKISTISITLLTILMFSNFQAVTSIQPVKAAVYPADDTITIPTWGAFTSPENFNPFLGASEGYHKGIWALYEHLFTYNAANGSVIPTLATGYAYDVGFGSIKIFLRHGVTWSDGEPFTANDVVFTLNMMKEHSSQLMFGPWAKQWIKDAVAMDNYTVVIWLTSPNSRFHWDLTSVICYSNVWVVPEHIWKNVDPATFMNYPPVWTGPYKVINVTTEAVVYERRDDYWGISVMGWVPQPKYIIWKYLGAETTSVEMAIENNQLSIGWFSSLESYHAAQERNPHLVRWQVVQPATTNLHVNIQKYPLSLPEVRWAISYGFDKAKVIELGGGASVSHIAKSLFPEYSNIQKFVYPDVLATYDNALYDPAKAIAMLEALGFTRGSDGIFVTPNGTRLSFELEMTSVFPSGQLLIDNMKDIGIEVTWRVVDYSIWWDDYVKLQYDLLWTGRYLCATSPYDVYKTFASNLSLPIGVASDPSTNVVRYSNAEYDMLLAQIEPMTDDDPRAPAIYKSLLTILMRDLPVIPVTIGFDSESYNDYYWTNWPDSSGGTNAYTVLLTWWSQFAFVTYNIRSRTLPLRLPPAKPITLSPEMQLAVNALNATIGTRMTSISSAVGNLDTKVSSVSDAVSNLGMAVYASVLLSLIAAIAAIVALMRTKQVK